MSRPPRPDRSADASASRHNGGKDSGTIRTLKSLGQHFLADKGMAARIVDGADVGPDDTVLEIGPGRGILTDILLSRAKRVVAIELDRGLHGLLEERFADEPRLTLHHRDALKFDPATIGEPYKLVANLPYQVTTPLLFHLLESTPPPDCMVVMIQEEVAHRILAQPGTREYGVLTLGVALRAGAKKVMTVKPGAFSPPPKVRSTVIRLTPLASPPLPEGEQAHFMRVVRAAMGTRRKTLKNALGALKLPNETVLEALDQCGLDPQVRGETLGLEAFVQLARALPSSN